MANRSEKSEVSNIVQIIRERYDSLNNTHKKIADFIL